MKAEEVGRSRKEDELRAITPPQADRLRVPRKRAPQ